MRHPLISSRSMTYITCVLWTTWNILYDVITDRCHQGASLLWLKSSHLLDAVIRLSLIFQRSTTQCHNTKRQLLCSSRPMRWLKISMCFDNHLTILKPLWHLQPWQHIEGLSSQRTTWQKGACPHYINIEQIHHVGMCPPLILERSTTGPNKPP